MSWIALRMLMGDRVKFFGIIFGVAFASLLIAQQMAIFCGLMRMTTNPIWNVQDVDLWVSDSDALAVSETKPMPETALYRVRGVPGVAEAAPLFKGVATARLRFDPLEIRQRRAYLATLPSRSYEHLTTTHEGTSILQQVMLIGVDESTMLGAPWPESMICGSAGRLRSPDAIVVDRFSCRLLWPDEKAALQNSEDYRRFVGRVIEVNNNRAEIVGVCKVAPNFESLPMMWTTYNRAQSMTPAGQRTLSYILVRAEPGVALEGLQRRITRRTDYHFRARTPSDFACDTVWYYIKRTGIPINFGITVALGFLVGAAIAGQTFYQFTVENLRQFGALKAMGTSNVRIVGITLLQSMVAGPIGFGIGVGLAALFGLANRDNPSLGFFMPWPVVMFTAIAVISICLLAGLLSVRRVLVLEPAIVFRA